VDQFVAMIVAGVRKTFQIGAATGSDDMSAVRIIIVGGPV
jgi:hypothetical protein